MPLSVLLRVALTQVSLFIQIVQDQKYITVTVVLDSISSHILGINLGFTTHFRLWIWGRKNVSAAFCNLQAI